MQTLTWNTLTGIVSSRPLSRATAQVQSVRGDETINLVVVGGGTSTAAYLPDAGLNVGIVIRPPANLKAGVFNGPVTFTRGETADQGYTIATSTDTTFTRGQMHVDDTDPASELPTLPTTAAFYLVPAGGGDAIQSLPFIWNITANYYRPLQPPADVVENYPPAAQVDTIAARDAAIAAAVAGVSPFVLRTYGTDADKLASTDYSGNATPAKPGEYAGIVGEGNRVEQFVPVFMLASIQITASTASPDDVKTYSLDSYGVYDTGGSGNFSYGIAVAGCWTFNSNSTGSLRTYSSAPTTSIDPSQADWSATPITVSNGGVNLSADQRNWIVLHNTIGLTFNNQSSNDSTVCGQSVASGSAQYIGWVYEDAIIVSSGEIYLSVVEDSDQQNYYLCSTDPNIGDSGYVALTNGTAIPLPFKCNRGAQIAVSVADCGY